MKATGVASKENASFFGGPNFIGKYIYWSSIVLLTAETKKTWHDATQRRVALAQCECQSILAGQTWQHGAAYLHQGGWKLR